MATKPLTIVLSEETYKKIQRMAWDKKIPVQRLCANALKAMVSGEEQSDESNPEE